MTVYEKWLIAFASLLIFCGNHARLAAAERPNIIVILTDDQGWGDLSVNGNTNLQTPNIDSLAREGATIDRFYVCPVCSPTRAEFLTGRYHTRMGVKSTSAGGERIDLGETTIAETLAEAGYATAAFGKWHNGMQYPYHPLGRGFQEYYGFCSGHWGDYFSPPLEHNGQIVRGEGFVIDDFTDHAIEFIDQHQDQPFFVYLPYNTPHSPMQVPDRWWETFANKQLGMRHRDPEKEDIPHTRAALAMVENIDWNVGRVLSHLKQRELEENTIVIYFSDNGPNGNRWNGDMKGRKGSTDEGGVRSPFFVRWPAQIPAGKVVSQIAAAIDLHPTLAEFAQAPVQATKPLDGKSIAPLLTDDDPQWDDRLLFSHWRGKVSVRNQRFRLDKDGRLFELATDPGQRRDVADEYPDVARTLQTALQQWGEEVGTVSAEEERPFTVGHPDFPYYQLPARDAVASGSIERSNRFPNCSFFTNWHDTQDAITWEIDVLQSGRFAVELHYACEADDVGAVLELQCGDVRLSRRIEQANAPPLRGAEHDRTERMESYVKDFVPLEMGTIDLPKGRHTLRLGATEKAGDEIAEVRLLFLTRVAADDGNIEAS